jgi:hypothetical protein
MNSKYKSKQSKPITKQGDRYIPKQYPRCTNCGRNSPLVDPQYSKCYCGGTFQFYGVTQ